MSIIQNPDFEGENGWSIERNGPSGYKPKATIKSKNSYAGTYCAELRNVTGSAGNPRSAYIRQMIDVPANATKLVCFVATAGDNWGAFRGIRINDTTLDEWHRSTNFDFTRKEYDITAFAGRFMTIELYLEDLSISAGHFDHDAWIRFDNFEIIAPTPPPTTPPPTTPPPTTLPPGVPHLRDMEILEEVNGEITEIKGYTCAFCPGSGTPYDYTVPEGWKEVSCKEVEMGSHGCCSSCVVIEIVLKKVPPTTPPPTTPPPTTPPPTTPPPTTPPPPEKCSIEIVVKNATTFEAVNNATVKAYEDTALSAQCTTNTDGNCTLTDLDPETWYNIVVSKNGYYDTTKNLNCQTYPTHTIYLTPVSTPPPTTPPPTTPPPTTPPPTTPPPTRTPIPAPPPCPTAALVMGTPLVCILPPLRIFRDKVLSKFKLGRKFIRFYYSSLTLWLSPKILKLRGRKN